MPYLLARLGPTVEPGVREVRARGREAPHAVEGAVQALRDGTLVLLQGREPPWSAATTVHPKRWPAGLPGPEPLWGARRPGTVRVAVPAACRGGHGNWTLDERGAPCEIGYGHTGGPVALVLNYAGWRITDFPPGLVEVFVCDTDVGVVWIVPPSAVPVPAAEPPPAPARADDDWPVPTPGDRGGGPASTRTPDAPPPAPSPPAPPRAPPPPAPVLVSRRLRFVDLTFTDGSVCFPLDARRVSLASPLARAVYEPVRDLLDEELPAGVRAVGEVHADGAFAGELHGLERLAAVFERALFRQFVRQSCAAREWLDAEALAIRRPGGGGRPDPGGLLDIPEFGLGKRDEAFRRLFEHRDRAERVSILPGRAVIVPLPARDGGPRWYAWETMEDDHATYLFRPADTDTRDAMFAWTQAPTVKRRELLDDRELQAELGYARRVMHHDAGPAQLGRWWARLCRAVGLTGG